MSQARAWSVALVGVEGTMVEVEAAISSGLPRTTMVGLPDTALYEARDRCRAAMASARFGWPSDPVTINLSPATLPKAGSHYDLAIAAAVAAAARRGSTRQHWRGRPCSASWVSTAASARCGGCCPRCWPWSVAASGGWSFPPVSFARPPSSKGWG